MRRGLGTAMFPNRSTFFTPSGLARRLLERRDRQDG